MNNQLQADQSLIGSTNNHPIVVVNDTAVPIHDHTPIGRQILNAAQLHPIDDYALLQLNVDGGLEEVAPDEAIKLNPANQTIFFAFRTDRLFYFTLNDRKYPWDATIKESMLRKLANAQEDVDIWLMRADQPDKMILNGELVNLTGDGVERFYTRAKIWQLDVQGIIIDLTTSTIVVAKALELAGINPNQPWTIILKVEGQPKQQLELTSVIDLATPGIERLRVMPRTINNGEGSLLRREFALLEKDQKFMDMNGLAWETAIFNNRRWLLIQNYKLPNGYTTNSLSVAIEIPENYPAAELDMFYCFPQLVLSNGNQIPQTESQEVIFESSYQRWSRHREGGTWSPVDDSVITHLGLIEESILREVGV